MWIRERRWSLDGQLGVAGCLLGAVLLSVGWITDGASAADDPAVGGTVSDIVIRLQPGDHSQLPTADEIGETDVALMRKDMNLYSLSDASEGSIPIEIKIKNLRGYRLSSGATDAVQLAVVQRINELGLGGVVCRVAAPKPDDSGSATVNIVAATVSNVQAVGLDEDQPRPVSADSIEQRSPIKTDGNEPPLLNVEAIDEYIAQLNRFPGRSVTASISAGENPGTLLLDYMVTEETTFNFYAEVSNTGTSSTSKWLERFGILATQISGNDDILSLQAVTDSFSETTRSANAYYDSRLGDYEDLRWRITGNWGDYTAADVGFLRQDFEGSTWGAQADVIWNFHQDGTLFLDLDAGVRYWNSETENTFFGFLMADGESEFITPTLSVTAYDIQPMTAMQATLGVEYTNATADQIELDELGRLNTSQESWVVFGSAHYSFYLDPLLDPEWDGNKATRQAVHEVTIRGQGQYAFDDRLTPLAMSSMGGYYTVRGYPQSTVAGDSSIQGSLEYRLHLPRMFDPEPIGIGLLGDDFRWAPDSETGSSPDWDLALLGFLDAANVWQSDSLSFEDDVSLLGAGVGAELTIRRNVKVTVNYGWALEDVESADVESGEGRLYFLGSVSF